MRAKNQEFQISRDSTSKYEFQNCLILFLSDGVENKIKPLRKKIILGKEVLEQILSFRDDVSE